MIKKAVNQLATLAIALLMTLAFVLPSLMMLTGSSATHQVLLEVCTDRGIQLVKLSGDHVATPFSGSGSKTFSRSFAAPASDKAQSSPSSPSSDSTLDHCPLCQLQALSSSSHDGLIDVAAKFLSQALPMGHARVDVTTWAWIHLPARAPPAHI
jgi:hypothetical protein